MSADDTKAAPSLADYIERIGEAGYPMSDVGFALYPHRKKIAAALRAVEAARGEVPGRLLATDDVKARMVDAPCVTCGRVVPFFERTNPKTCCKTCDDKARGGRAGACGGRAMKL